MVEYSVRTWLFCIYLFTLSCKCYSSLVRRQTLYTSCIAYAELWAKLRKLHPFVIELWARLSKLYAFVTELWSKLSKTYAFVTELWAKLSKTYAFVTELCVMLSKLHAFVTDVWERKPCTESDVNSLFMIWNPPHCGLLTVSLCELLECCLAGYLCKCSSYLSSTLSLWENIQHEEEHK